MINLFLLYSYILVKYSMAKMTPAPDVVNNDDDHYKICHPVTGPAAKSKVMTRMTLTRHMDKSG